MRPVFEPNEAHGPPSRPHSLAFILQADSWDLFTLPLLVTKDFDPFQGVVRSEALTSFAYFRLVPRLPLRQTLQSLSPLSFFRVCFFPLLYFLSQNLIPFRLWVRTHLSLFTPAILETLEDLILSDRSCV